MLEGPVHSGWCQPRALRWSWVNRLSKTVKQGEQTSEQGFFMASASFLDLRWFLLWLPLMGQVSQMSPLKLFLIMVFITSTETLTKTSPIRPTKQSLTNIRTHGSKTLPCTVQLWPQDQLLDPDHRWLGRSAAGVRLSICMFSYHRGKSTCDEKSKFHDLRLAQIQIQLDSLTLTSLFLRTTC